MQQFKEQVHETTQMRIIDLLPKKVKHMIYRIAHQDKYKGALLMIKHLRKDPDVISRGLSKKKIQDIAADHFKLNHREFAKILNRKTRYEEAPPGMADTVKKFKADGMDDEMAFALAWKIYNKKEEYITEEKGDDILPDDFLGGLPHEVDMKASSGVRTVYKVRSSDREADRDEILRILRQAGVTAQIGSGSSSVDPIDGEFDNMRFRILVKPVSGGMGETTLNSSITELFPCIAFETNYNPKSVEEFHKYLLGVDVSKLSCVLGKDLAAAEETINKADTSTKFAEKMENAIGIWQFLKDQHKDKPIKNVYWGYRAKPAGVGRGHPGDMFIEYTDKKMLGVSLKAGGKKTSEPQLNTYVRPVFDAFKESRTMASLRSKAYQQVYSKIKDMPAEEGFDGGPNGRHKDRAKTENILKVYDKKNNRAYEKDYDTMLEIMRQGIVDLFNKNKKKTVEYIIAEILRDAPGVPTMVIKAIGSTYEEVTDRNEVGVFLPQVKFVKAVTARSSKQNWYIILQSGNDSITMAMSIRSNKSGHAGKKKLGQFPLGLAVKYNGIAK